MKFPLISVSEAVVNVLQHSMSKMGDGTQVNKNSLCANRQRVEHLCQKIPLFAKFQRNTEMLGRKLPSRHMGNQDLLHQLILPQLTTTSYPLKYAGVRGANPHPVKNPCITCDSPKT